MARYQQNGKNFLLQTPPLLRSETAEEFNAFRENLNDEIKPEGPIERMYADEFAYICWDILRFRRAKAIMIDVGSRRALEHLLQQIESNSTLHNVGDSPEDVSWLYFRNPSAKQAVLQIMELCQLDETAIAAQAIQDALPSLEIIEMMLASLERRRDRALLFIAEYRGNLAQRMRESADRMLEREALPQLQDRSSLKITP